jgi:hypothetical protein
MAIQSSLKATNRRYLVGWVVTHTLVAVWIVAGLPLAFDDLVSMPIVRVLGLAVIAPLSVMLLNGLPSRRLKSALVFWTWPCPDPGHRAFSELAHSDSRIDIKALQFAVGGAFPEDPRDQNTSWMGLYNANESVPAVRTNHGEWLLFRDLVWLSCLATVLNGVGAVILTGASRPSLVYVFASGCLVLLCTIVARNHGNRFVCTVMACASAGKVKSKEERGVGDTSG